jgi:hypothetical protein
VLAEKRKIYPMRYLSAIAPRPASTAPRDVENREKT